MSFYAWCLAAPCGHATNGTREVTDEIGMAYRAALKKLPEVTEPRLCIRTSVMHLTAFDGDGKRMSNGAAGVKKFLLVSRRLDPVGRGWPQLNCGGQGPG